MKQQSSNAEENEAPPDFISKPDEGKSRDDEILASHQQTQADVEREKPDEFFIFTLKDMFLYTAAAAVGAAGTRLMPEGHFAFVVGLLAAALLMFIVLSKNTRREASVLFWILLIGYLTACGTAAITTQQIRTAQEAEALNAAEQNENNSSNEAPEEWTIPSFSPDLPP